MGSWDEDSMVEMRARWVGFYERWEELGGRWLHKFAHEDKPQRGENLDCPYLEEEDEAFVEGGLCVDEWWWVG